MFEQKHSKGAYWSTLGFGVILATLAAMACMLAYSGMGCEPTDPGHGCTIEGTVVDRETSLPIDSAWVSLNPRADTLPPTHKPYTDTSGYFQIGMGWGCPQAVDLYAGKSGYETVHEVIHTGGQDAKGIVIDLKKSSE